MRDHLGGMILKYHQAAIDDAAALRAELAESRKQEEHLRSDNRRLAEDIRNLQGEDVTLAEGVKLADRKTDAALGMAAGARVKADETKALVEAMAKQAVEGLVMPAITTMLQGQRKKWAGVLAAVIVAIAGSVWTKVTEPASAPAPAQSAQRP